MGDVKKQFVKRLDITGEPGSRDQIKIQNDVQAFDESSDNIKIVSNDPPSSPSSCAPIEQLQAMPGLVNSLKLRSRWGIPAKTIYLENPFPMSE